MLYKLYLFGLCSYADVVVPVRGVSARDVCGCSVDADVYAVCAGL